MPAPEPVDEALWFACSEEPEGRDYLVGNAHTFRGRISAYCPRKEGSPYYNVSASEVLSDCSDESRRWVQGFLAGQEPTPPKDDQGDYLPFDHPEAERWRASARAWAATGRWPDQE